MPDIEITCPECGNKRAVPGDLVGKKIKCKKCQSVFTVKAPAPAQPAAKTAAKPVAKNPSEKVTGANPAVFGVKKEEEEDATPYTMREENLAARCPHCALPLEPPDAKICIHCGYHMQHRRRVESKKTYQVTAGDYILWHLPTVGCFIGIGILIGFDAFCVINMSDWMRNAWWEDVVPAGCFSTWIVIFSLFAMFFLARFIFRRLVWNFTPAERIKRDDELDDADEDDYEDDDEDEDD